MIFPVLATLKTGAIDPKAGEPVSRRVRTQVGRALAQLSIRHIAGCSPEARGRSERAFRTLQDRLPKELALAGIATIAAANRWAAESYLPAHNVAFAVAPEQTGTAFVPDILGRREIPLPPGGAPGRQRQHRQVARAHFANPIKPAAPEDPAQSSPAPADR